MTCSAPKRCSSALAQSCAADRRAQTITVGPDPESVAPSAPPGSARRTSVQKRRPVGLVQPVVERCGEGSSDPEASAAPSSAARAGRESRIAVRDLLEGERLRGLGGEHAGFRHDADRHRGNVVGHTSDAVLPREADASCEGRGEIVAVTFEVEPGREQRLGIGIDAGSQRTGDQAERDDTAALGTEAALTWNAIDELEAASRQAERAVRTPGCRDGISSGAPSPSLTSNSFHRSSATAAQSKPGPRLAVVAGALTRIVTGRRRRSRPGLDPLAAAEE